MSPCLPCLAPISPQEELEAQAARQDEAIAGLERTLVELLKDKQTADATDAKRAKVPGHARKFIVCLPPAQSACAPARLDASHRPSPPARPPQDVHEINAVLAAFADDEAFQKDLQRPMVRAALDLLWGSGEGSEGSSNSSSSSSNSGTTARLASVKADEGVIRISPLLKRFEGVCERARVRFPAGHLLARRRELSVEAVISAFGPAFADRYFSGRAIFTPPIAGAGAGAGAARGQVSSVEDSL